jgi:FG-GAP-like repeat
MTRALLVGGSVIVIAATTSGTVAGRQANGTASLPRYGPVTPFGTLSGPGTVAASGAVGAADFNGDGLVDVAFARALGGAPAGAQDTFPLGVLLNDGRGRLVDLPARIFEGAPPRNQWGRQLIVADFNNDGRPDIYLPDTGPEAVNYGPPPGYHDTLILSTAAGKLHDATAGIPQQSDFTHSAAAADVDRDGDIDLFVGNIGGNLAGSGSCCDVQIWINDGEGRFAVGQGRLPPALGTDNVYTSSGFADVNGDKAPDLVLAGGHGCALRGHVQRNDQQVLLNDGQGRFRVLPGALPEKPFGISGEGQAVDVVDLDVDGHVDLLLTYTSARQLSAEDCTNDPARGRFIQVLMGNGDGTFRDETATRLPQPDTHAASLDFILALDLADLDGDGAPDIFTQLLIPPGGDPAYAGAYRHDGKGAFSPLPAGYPFLDLKYNVHALVDFSGTGRRDLFMLNWDARGDLLYRRLQNGRPVKPGPPAEVRVTRDPASGKTVVAWPYDWGAARYEVWRSGRRIGVTRLTRFVDTTAVPGSTYRVRALNSAGASAFSVGTVGP